MKTNVIMIPRNHECIRKLRSSLSKTDVEVKLLRPSHYSSFINLAKIKRPVKEFLLPFFLLNADLVYVF